MTQKALPAGRPGIKANAAAQRQDRKRPRGRPSRLDGPDFWLMLDRVIGILGQGGTDALAARVIQIQASTFSDWRAAGERVLADMDDTVRDELRAATSLYFTPISQGGNRGALVTFNIDRLAKLASVIEQAEANWAIMALSHANADSRRKGGGRIALQMLTRRFGPSIYPPAHLPQESPPPDPNAANGGTGAIVQVRRVTIAVPANGFRPGDEDAEPVTDKRRRQKPARNRKAG